MDKIRQVQDDASRVSETESKLDTIRLLDDLREQGNYSEMSLYT